MYLSLAAQLNDFDSGEGLDHKHGHGHGPSGAVLGEYEGGLETEMEMRESAGGVQSNVVYRLRSRLIRRKMVLDLDSSDSEEETEGKRIDDCGKEKCLTCPSLNNSLYFESHVTMRRYMVANKNVQLNCESRDVIYLISCSRCGVQYVGETKQMVRSRLNQHRSSVRLNKIGTHLAKHFRPGPSNVLGCCLDDMTIQPLEYVGAGDKRTRVIREDYWIKELRTMYPYGLNERHEDGDATKNIRCVWSTFNKTKRAGRMSDKRKQVDTALLTLKPTI